MQNSQNTAAVLIAQLWTDAKDIAHHLALANQAAAEGRMNEAIGTMLGVENQIDRLNQIKGTILALHQS